ncbi:MAG: acyltransferase family protein [Bacteroidales bacterium]
MRNIPLDWLRGICAIAIMLYHFFLPATIANPLNRLGIYAVSIFFILSGLSLAMSWNNKQLNKQNTKVFFLKRFLRIYPLFSIICLLTFLSKYISNQPLRLDTLFSNLFLYFSVIHPGDYYAVGAWSIGNEIVYYIFTPVIIYGYNHHLRTGNILWIISILISLIFSYNLLNPQVPLMEQWDTYINPFNNLFLFVSGIALYYNTTNLKVNKSIAIAAIILLSSLICFYPLSGSNQSVIIAGSIRIWLSAASISLVFFIYKLNITKAGFIGKFFEQIGIATYGIYLIHPIMLTIIGFIFKKTGLSDKLLYYSLTAASTIMLALLSYYYFEKPIMNLAKKFTSQSICKRPEEDISVSEDYVK